MNLNAAFEPYLQNIENNYKGNDKEALIKQTRAAFLQRLIDNILIEQEAKNQMRALWSKMRKSWM